jgi:flagellar motor protein MotB
MQGDKDARNLKLSQERAEAVRDHLTKAPMNVLQQKGWRYKTCC